MRVSPETRGLGLEAPKCRRLRSEPLRAESERTVLRSAYRRAIMFGRARRFLNISVCQAHRPHSLPSVHPPTHTHTPIQPLSIPVQPLLANTTNHCCHQLATSRHSRREASTLIHVNRVNYIGAFFLLPVFRHFIFFTMYRREKKEVDYAGVHVN